MKHADKWFLYSMIGGVVLLIGVMMVTSAPPASAQCGTSASSCKNCHETQGKMPVADKGDWHKAHAFGDFCEFCHAGNVQAATAEEAHKGMVSPLSDIKASCQSCHPNDYEQRAGLYAATLGVKLDAGSGDTTGGGEAAPGPDKGSDSSGCTTGGTAVSAPLGGEQIDYNLLYAQATTPPPLISNWGNVILILLILGTAVVFFMTVWSWENWGQKAAGWIDKNVAPVPQAITAAIARSDGEVVPADSIPPMETLLAQKPELRRLLPRLVELPPEILTALGNILTNPEQIRKILSAGSRQK